MRGAAHQNTLRLALSRGEATPLLFQPGPDEIMSKTSQDQHKTRWRFLAPFEQTQPTLDELLWRAWPDSTQAQRRSFIEELGRVTVNELIVRDPTRRIAPDSVIELVPELGAEIAGLPEAEELARGPGWVIVQKPVGMPSLHDPEDPMNSILFLADLLGLDRDTFTPALHLPTQAGGPWLFGMTSEDAVRLADAWRSGELMITFRAIIPRQDRPQGLLTGPAGLKLSYAVTRYEGGLCEVQLIPQYRSNTPKGTTFEPVTFIRKTLAQAGIAILGDRLHSGYMVSGGLRLRVESLLHDPSTLAHSWAVPERDWWPDEPVFDLSVSLELEGDDDEGSSRDGDADLPWERGATGRDRTKKPNKINTLDFPKLKVSDKTLQIMSEQHHPWVLADSQTGGRGHLKPGTVVALEGKRSKARGPWALIEGEGELAARRWAEADDVEAVTEFKEEVLARVDESIVRRADLLRDMANTNLFRLVHAEADGLPGLCIDRVGDIIRATLLGQASRGFRKLVYDNILAFDPHVTILEVWHTEDVRQRGELPRARHIHGEEPGDDSLRIIGLEDGLRYWCEPWQGIDTGFFADQRNNRRTLKKEAAPGQRWLNLFGHTGAFSVALASRGAQVVNVDVSKRYLDWTRDNFLLNRLDPDLDVPAALDARTYVKQLAKDERFDGIIVDPPTAAQGKAGFWSVRKDYGELLADCFAHLVPGGVMLVCRNDRKAKKGSLEPLIRQAAQQAGVAIHSIEDAPPGHDYPSLEGFPEGDQFEGFIVRTSRQQRSNH